MADVIKVMEMLQLWDAERAKETKAFIAGSDALRSYFESRGCRRCFSEYDNLPPAKKRQLVTGTKAYEDYLNPSLRKKGRYYCAKHVMPLNAAIGCSDGFAGVSGHICWAFTSHSSYHEASRWHVGTFAANLSVDLTARELKKTLLTSYNEIQIDRPGIILKSFGCNMQKNISAEDGNYEEAMLRSMKISETAYFLLFNNCMDATHFILDGFGVDGLPLPFAHGPYSYFAQINAPIITL